MMKNIALLSLLCGGCLVGEFEGAGGSRNGNALLPPGKQAFVLAHGFAGSSESFDATIVAAIEAEGHAVLRTEVPAVDGVAERAAVLGPQIDKFLADTGATKVHVIAHSMGGLDARYAISKLGYGAKVSSLTTLSTPHRGTLLADVALGIVDDADVSQEKALEKVAELAGLPVDSEALQRALVDLSEANAATFNAAILDVPGVAYESYAGLATPGSIGNPNADAACATVAQAATVPDPDSTRFALVLTQPIVARGGERIPNDAVVAVPSAKWGTFQGCLPADHLAETALDGGVDAAFYKALAIRLAQ